ncbi:tRNA glutamyl-Q(34) synthetase GluQRS [Altererythrobacter luteolus]|uniref:tRNA glutamyl-Q(34) synthetase GluQRS n=1 Tax=Pontixanthobacter luteolus TaxID=295089 RepID=A0A6I4V2G0_9SPHN|nr:tRNA glutamyl-Q(34) synthetase GluQRS [Pontixanthobacter luteolus]MXP48103.1 tRNA glutamyl-Q(34) synthetase GluQRS [Pontixanthobacter luteolus]
MIVTRFAPSPNGMLHLGHAYSAIVAHDLAREGGGRFLLRIEDIDGPRSKPELAEAFRRDLQWLGLEWEEVPAQSTRLVRYEQAARDVLIGQHGVLYPCTCTRAEIAASATQSGPDGPIYPGTCKGRSIDPNRPDAAFRIDMAKAMEIAGPLTWRDALVGEQAGRPDLFGDVVLIRKDAPASYHLAVTLDDASDGITLVTRGADLFAATHIHRLLQELLGLPVPVWHHHDLLLDESGQKLAKRRDSASLQDRRLAGEDGLALAKALRSGNLPAGISLGR